MNLIGFLIFHRFYDKFLIDGFLLKKTECTIHNRNGVVQLRPNCVNELA